MRNSCIIITRNRKEEVLRCLRSIAKQTLQPEEIIVVDNHSSDGTPQAIAEFFPLAKVIALSSNLGVTGGRNAGIRAAKNCILTFIDDDAEFVSPDAFERIVSLFKENADLGLVNFSIVEPLTNTPERGAICRTDKKHPELSYETAYFCGCGFAMKREVTLELGLFWECLSYGCEELDFSYRLVSKNYRIWHEGRIVVLHWKTQTARPAGRALYSNARNRLLIGLRWLPVWALISSVSLWWCRLAFEAVRYRQIPQFAEGVFDGIRAAPEAIAIRSPISWPIIQRIRKFKGRLWY